MAPSSADKHGMNSIAPRESRRLPSATESRLNIICFSALAAVAVALCLTRIGDRDLWQDEAETAVLARSVLRSGTPKARIDGNLVFQGAAAFDRDDTWTFHPWAQFYVAAAAMNWWGDGNAVLRAPFALCGVMTILLLYVFVRRHWRDTPTAFVCSLLLATSATFILHVRQCRYYALSGLFALVVVMSLFELMRRPERKLGWALGVALALLFYSDFGTLFAMAPGLAVAVLLMRPTRRHFIALGWSLGLALLLCIPGLMIHGQRLLAREPKDMLLCRRIITHLIYFDGWFIPFLAMGAAVAVLIVRFRTAITDRHRIAVGCGIIATLSAVLMAFPAPYPHVRYFIAQMPLAKLFLGLLLMGMHRWIRARSPIFAHAVLAICLLLLTQTNLASIPMQYVVDPRSQRTPDFCTSQRPYLRADFAGLMYELTHDFAGPDRMARRIVDDLARPNEIVLTNYGDLPLMFARPDLRIRGGPGGGARPCGGDEKPDLIIIHTGAAKGVPFIDYLSALTAAESYRPIRLMVPDIPYGNIPEPRAHFYATPSETSELYIFVRADHADRRSGLPDDAAELVRRWSSR